MDESHATPPTLCPHCGYKIDRATSANANGPAPKPGDMSICLGCGWVLIFEDGLRIRAATLEELDKLDPDERAMMNMAKRTIRLVRLLMNEKPEKPDA